MAIRMLHEGHSPRLRRTSLLLLLPPGARKSIASRALHGSIGCHACAVRPLLFVLIKRRKLGNGKSAPFTTPKTTYMVLIPLHHRALEELFRHVREARQNLAGALPHGSLVVRDAVLLAEGAHDLVRLGKAVARQRRPEVVLHLVLEPAAEPVHERVARDVARGADLELPEVRALVRLVERHAVVAEAKDDGEHEAARAGGDEEEGDGAREGARLRAESAHPRVVDEEANTLEPEVRHKLLGHLQVLRLPGERVREDEGEGALEPGQASKAEDGEVAEGLVRHEPLGQLRVRRLRHAVRPRQQWHGVDVRIAVLRGRRGLVEVRHRVVRVVLVFPPGNVEALPDVTNHHASEVAEAAVLEDLVVQEVVREPAALLPEERKEKRAHKVHVEVIRVEHEGPGNAAERERAEALPDVVDGARIEEARLLELHAQVAVGLLELGLRLRLLQMRRRLGKVQLADAELLHGLVGRHRVERSEGVRHVITSVGEDHQATRVIRVVAHIVHLVAVDHPGVIRRAVLVDLVPGVLLRERVRAAAEARAGVRALTHGCLGTAWGLRWWRGLGYEVGGRR
mmetsp:Transcript_9771/g.28690  ORF Transcript_9771/g.28690 Transcript_9771/m.28690 type:complete len:569 (-) Transcript_9771:44-1750(-)